MAAVATSGPSRGAETYTFSSQPRSTAAGSQTKKLAALPSDSNLKQQGYGNIMYDRRVIRGNTYALHTLPAGAQPDVVELQKQEELRRRSAAKRRARDQARAASPEAISGRKHMDIQTELYLEELTDRVEDADNFTQTDAFLDRPPTPLFVPAKTGRDVETQIGEGDLFDFELESRPIIEVLVGKTVEQALLEVLEEEELSALREQQRQFEQKRHAELVETQRLEEQDRRRTHEKEKRMQQQREALLMEKETAKKIAARAFAKSYLTDLVPSVFDALTAHGYFYDHVEREIVEDFIPWLMGEVKQDLTNSINARRMLDDLIMDALGYKKPVEVVSLIADDKSEVTQEIPAVLPAEVKVELPEEIQPEKKATEEQKEDVK
ncbi:Radial spoke 3 protein [Oopsacas minuta]|uniref:Radial spoke 3 protein n=1 Tax=Oopsacas minuta TaxID=111878 RepID=A0AAV7K8T5_9METZ|nr:Radial spoke 3 protein [Oopsacas minuta]